MHSKHSVGIYYNDRRRIQDTVTEDSIIHRSRRDSSKQAHHIWEEVHKSPIPVAMDTPAG